MKLKVIRKILILLTLLITVELTYAKSIFNKFMDCYTYAIMVKIYVA